MPSICVKTSVARAMKVRWKLEWSAYLWGSICILLIKPLGENSHIKRRGTRQKFWKVRPRGMILFCRCSLKFFSPQEVLSLNQHVIFCHILFQLNVLKGTSSLGWTHLEAPNCSNPLKVRQAQVPVLLKCESPLALHESLLFGNIVIPVAIMFGIRSLPQKPQHTNLFFQQRTSFLLHPLGLLW